MVLEQETQTIAVMAIWKNPVYLSRPPHEHRKCHRAGAGGEAIFVHYLRMLAFCDAATVT
jgi:hypothetical protein